MLKSGFTLYVIIVMLGIIAAVLLYTLYRDISLRAEKRKFEKAKELFEGSLANAENFVILDPVNNEVSIFGETNIDVNEITSIKGDKTYNFEWKSKERPVKHLLGSGENRAIIAERQDEKVTPLLTIEQIDNITSGSSVFEEMSDYIRGDAEREFKAYRNTISKIGKLRNATKKSIYEIGQLIGYEMNYDEKLKTSVAVGMSRGREETVPKGRIDQILNVEEEE